MDIKSLKGIAVVSIAGGEKLGSVEDVIVDSQSRAVGAFKLESGGLLRKDHCYLPFEAAQSIGSDAIMVRDDTVLHSTFGERPSGYHTLGNIGSVKVVSESGEYLGKLDTLQFDPATGTVTDFEVSKPGLGGVLGRSTVVGAASVTSIGHELMVVPDAIAEARGA